MIQPGSIEIFAHGTILAADMANSSLHNRLDTHVRARLRERAARGILLVIRRSDPIGQRGNEGSKLHQNAQTRYLSRFDLEEFPVQVLDVMESAKEDVTHEILETILRRMSEERVGVIVFAYGSRMARDEEDGARLLKAASRKKVVFIIKGQLFDPRDPHQHAQLMQMISAARLENVEKTFVVASAQYELVRARKMMVKLPAGLMYADPRDPVYASLLAEQGLSNWISKDQLDRHLHCCERGAAVLYVLPDPYPEVFRACQLISGWMLEHRCLAEVKDRIRTDPSYPKPGLVPMQQGHRFGIALATQWQRVRGKWLKGWMRSPALYGIYQHTAVALGKFVDVDDPEYRLEDAFPSFMHPRDREAILAGLDALARAHRAGRYKGPRNHAIPLLICSDQKQDGTICNRRIYPTYNRAGEHTYFGVCKGTHSSTYSARIDSTVIELLTEVFTPEALASATEQVEKTFVSSRERRNYLRDQLEVLESRIEVASGKEERAALSGDRREESHWEQVRRRNMDEWDRLKADLSRLEKDAAELRQLTEHELQRIQSLVVQVGALLSAARELEENGVAEWRNSDRHNGFSPSEGLVRRIVGRTTSAVRIRSLARGIQHVEVVFPTGDRLARLTCTVPVACSQPERAWIHHRLDRGVTPDEVASELNRIDGGHRRNPWTASMVETAKWMHRIYEEPARSGRSKPVEALAAEIKQPVDAVLRAAFGGDLGPAKIRAGQLALNPNLQELHEAFPSFARRQVAEQQGWREEDTLRIGDLARQLQVSIGMIEGRAKRSPSGICRDLAGRRYVHWADVARAPCGLDVALEGEPESLRSLPRENWLTLGEVRERLPGICRERLVKETKYLPGTRPRLYYVSPEVEANLRMPTLAEAVNALGLSVADEDFLDLISLSRLLRGKLGYRSLHPVMGAVEAGHLLQVYARPHRRPFRRRIYIYLPPELRKDPDSASLRIWLRGENPTWRPSHIVAKDFNAEDSGRTR